MLDVHTCAEIKHMHTCIIYIYIYYTYIHHICTYVGDTSNTFVHVRTPLKTVSTFTDHSRPLRRLCLRSGWKLERTGV